MTTGAGLYDLHLHTTASDGALSPRELVGVAKEQGLRALALTDHDTVTGIAEASEEAARLGIELVPGIEASAGVGDVSVHVLGLFIDYREPKLVAFLEDAAEQRVGRIHEIVAKLARLGIEIDAGAVLARSTHGTVGRPHVAEVLVSTGVVRTPLEAFEKYLGQDGPAYVGYDRATVRDVVDLIHGAGGIASLAHPFLFGNDEIVRTVAEDGIDAIEAFHRDHPPEKEAEYESLARGLGLLVSGGSDFHQAEEGQPARLGCPRLDEELFEELRRAAR